MPANGPFSNNGTITLDQLIKISRSDRCVTSFYRCRRRVKKAE